ncbi:MAG: hypothetical protein Q9160_008940 [Pyrenula sp. 1 TL-2023]
MEEEERPRKQRRLNPHDEAGGFEQEKEKEGIEGLEAREGSVRSTSELDKSTEDIDGESDENRPTAEVGKADGGIEDPTLSKSQLKKLRRQEKWAAGKEFRKAKRKQKAAERKQRKREAREQSSKETNGPELSPPPVSAARNSRSSPLPVTFVIDCGFDDLMTEKERISLASQLTRAYSDNHRAPLQGHLTVSSFGAKLKERFETVLASHHKNWKNITFLKADFEEASKQSLQAMGETADKYKMDGIFASKSTVAVEDLRAQSEVVYLTSESPDTLQELRPYSTYIIGGLVDKNRHKGICYKVACDKGIKTAKLPISEHMEMQSRYVLATNHVVEIMLAWLACGDWGEAFLKAIPKRKGGSLKSTVESSLGVAPRDATSQCVSDEQEVEKLDGIEGR